MDSIVLWVRGNGGFTLAMEKTFGGVSKKAKVNVKLDSTQWTHLQIHPQDFLAANNQFGNVGWSAVRDSVTHLTLFMTGTGDFWLDDVRIYGISPDDLR